MKKIYFTKNVKFKSTYGIIKKPVKFETVESYLGRGGEIKTTKLRVSVTPNLIFIRESLALAA